jgi:hypothetical protein
MASTPWECHGRRFGWPSIAACERSERPCFRRDGKPRLTAPPGEFALAFAGQGATFGHTVLHRGNDVMGKRNLRIGRRQVRNGRRPTMNLVGG